MSWFARFAAAAADHAHRPALVTPEQTLTYGDLLERAECWHRAHAGEAGRVVSASRDPLESFDALLGGWRAGRSVALLPSTFSAPVLAALQERLANPMPAKADPARRELYVLTTSGTTGLPKLVAQGERCVTTILDNPLPWHDMAPGARTLITAPLATPVAMHHLIVALTKGCEVNVFPPGTAIPGLLDYLLKQQITMVCGSISFYSVLLGYGPHTTFPGVTLTRLSGEAVTAPLQERLLAAFPNAAQFVIYGSTDAMRIASLPLGDPRIPAGCVGAPEPHYEISIRPLPGLPSGQGELYVRGPAACLGYIGLSGGYEGLTPDGWLPMRDVVELAPDGSLYVRGRVDALFKCGGQWVNPLEVEQVLATVPGVAEVRCFAEPHPLLGSVPVAEVVPAPGMVPVEGALASACGAALQRHQVPREFRMVPDVARGASGKKLRG